MIHIRKRWQPVEGEPLTELDEKVLKYQNNGSIVPWRSMIKTPEQIEGIRKSGIINKNSTQRLKYKQIKKIIKIFVYEFHL